MRTQTPWARLLCGALAVVFAVALSGCEVPYVDQPAKRSGPSGEVPYRRIVIAGFFDKTARPETAAEFSAALREKLTERTSNTDVVIVPQSAFPALTDPFVTGTLPVEVLVQARQEFLANLLVVGSVDAHSPYVPLSIHLSVKAIDTGTGQVPFELSTGWNAGDRPVKNAIAAFYQRNIGSDDCRFGPDVFQVSPSYFMRFVAAELADRMTVSMQRK